MSRSLNDVVTKVASELMAANGDTATAISEHVLTDLAAYLVLDSCFLRHNDHELHAGRERRDGLDHRLVAIAVLQRRSHRHER